MDIEEKRLPGSFSAVEACARWAMRFLAPLAAKFAASCPEPDKPKLPRLAPEKYAPLDPERCWTLHSDGSYDPKNGRGGIGAALYNPQGQLVACVSKPVHIGKSVRNGPSCAEYLAAAAGLELACAAGAEFVSLRVDNQALAGFAQGVIRYGAPLTVGDGALEESKIKMVRAMPSFSGLCATWVSRSQNELADQLSKIGSGKKRQNPRPERGPGPDNIALARHPKRIMGSADKDPAGAKTVSFVLHRPGPDCPRIFTGARELDKAHWQPPEPDAIRCAKLPSTASASLYAANCAIRMANFFCKSKKSPSRSLCILMFDENAYNMVCAKTDELNIPPTHKIHFVLHKPDSPVAKTLARKIAQTLDTWFDPNLPAEAALKEKIKSPRKPG